MIMLGLEAPDHQALLQRLVGNGLTTLLGAIRIGTPVNQVMLLNYAYHSMAHPRPISGIISDVLVCMVMVMYARSTGQLKC